MRRSFLDVPQADPVTFPVMDASRTSAAEIARSGSHNEKTEFAGTGAPVEIGHRDRVTVVPARPGRLRHARRSGTFQVR